MTSSRSRRTRTRPRSRRSARSASTQHGIRAHVGRSPRRPAKPRRAATTSSTRQHRDGSRCSCLFDRRPDGSFKEAPSRCSSPATKQTPARAPAALAEEWREAIRPASASSSVSRRQRQSPMSFVHVDPNKWRARQIKPRRAGKANRLTGSIITSPKVRPRDNAGTHQVTFGATITASTRTSSGRQRHLKTFAGRRTSGGVAPSRATKHSRHNGAPQLEWLSTRRTPRASRSRTVPRWRRGQEDAGSSSDAREPEPCPPHAQLSGALRQRCSSRCPTIARAGQSAGKERRRLKDARGGVLNVQKTRPARPRAGRTHARSQAISLHCARATRYLQLTTSPACAASLRVEYDSAEDRQARREGRNLQTPRDAARADHRDAHGHASEREERARVTCCRGGLARNLSQRKKLEKQSAQRRPQVGAR